jgi:hypothetical protein
MNTNVVYLNYGEVPTTGPRGNLTNVLRVTIKVGDFGPFTKDFSKDTSADVVKQWAAQKQADVVATCGCS